MFATTAARRRPYVFRKPSTDMSSTVNRRIGRPNKREHIGDLTLGFDSCSVRGAAASKRRNTAELARHYICSETFDR
jgi:hypothetical protein